MLTSKWAEAGVEPSLKELMSDPIVQLIMKRDNLAQKDVWKIIKEAKNNIDTNAA